MGDTLLHTSGLCLVISRNVWEELTTSTFLQMCVVTLSLCNNSHHNFILSLHRALWTLYIVHSPTIALYIKLGEV